jgi:hypothetical protein
MLLLCKCLLINFNFSCTKIQKEFDVCMKEKLNLDRPPLGDLSRVRLFDAERPIPSANPKKVFPQLPEPPNLADLDKYPEVIDSIKRTSRKE